jgi:cytochrome c-type biogenesis protein CcmF
MSPFITHGGIESPLHGFTGSPFPPYILAFIIIILVVFLWLVYTRRGGPEEQQDRKALISGHGAFLLTDTLLVLLVAVIFLGTILPRLVELFGGARMTLDRSFFDRTCGPILLVIVLLVGICPLLGWLKASWRGVRKSLLYSLVPAVIIAVIILATGAGNWYAAAAIVCGFPLLVAVLEPLRGAWNRSRAGGGNYFKALAAHTGGNRVRYGGFLAHAGVILMALGIIGSSFYPIEKTETLHPGETMTAGDYLLIYEGMTLKQDNTKLSAVATVGVERNDRTVSVMNPSFDYWYDFGDSFSEVAVRTTPAEDLFISLVWTTYDPADESATFRVLVNPLVVWIWIGGGFFILGGIFSLSAKDTRKSRGR